MVKIARVRLRRLTGTLDYDGEFWEERLIQPIDIYPDQRQAAKLPETPVKVGDGRYQIVSIFLEIETDDGVSGIAGPVSEDVAFIIDRQMRSLLLGEDALATERIWDRLYRNAIHGRKGPTMLAISMIDCALWDLRGKAAGLPVHRLLGGPIRETIPAYASALGYSLELDKVRERAKAIVGAGFGATKWFFRDGPTDGRPGMARNLALMQTLRETVGPDVEIMLDAWSSWDVPYTLTMARQLVDYRPRWIEEPVLADRIAACAEIHRKSPVPIATGEHEYTRWGLKQLMDANAADVLQPDIYWAGGISEVVKICTLASTYDVQVIPHGHSVPATVQVLAAQPPTLCPYVEYLILWNEVHQFFWKNPVKPVNGMVTVPIEPGMGVAFDPAKIEDEREMTWS